MDASPKIYGLTFIEQPDYLHARATEHIVSRQSAMLILGDIMIECANRRHKNLLLEREVSDRVNDDEFLDALIEMAHMNSGTRIAFLDRHLTDENCLPLKDCDCRCFQSKEDAEKWLLANELKARN